MKILSLIIASIFAFSGSFILIRALKNSQKIYFGVVSSRLDVLSNAFWSGLSFSLLFLSLISLGSALENDFTWSIQEILGSLAVAFLTGLVVFIGAFIGFIIIAGYRETVIKKVADQARRNKQK